MQTLRRWLANRNIRQIAFGIALVLACGGFAQQVAYAAPQFPTGFLRTQITSGYQFGLSDFSFLPDSQGAVSRNMLALSKAGNIRFVSASGESRQVGALAGVFDTGDLGAVSLSLAPNYLSSRQVAILATYQASPLPLGRVDIYTVDDAVNPTSLTFTRTVLGGITQNNNQNGGLSHGPGTVIWAQDGTLYAGFGDAAQWNVVDQAAFRSLDPDDPHGKILRVNATGQGVPGNPYYNAASPDSWRSRMFASGHRNPFRFSLDPQRSNVLYVGDVGWGTYEKITIERAGTVGGWPCFEGVNSTGGYRTPGYQDLSACQAYYQNAQINQPGTNTYKETIPRPTAALWNMLRTGMGAAIVGGTFYNGTSYPPVYQGAYFFANYPPDSPSKLFSLRTDGTTLTRAPEAGGFASSIGGPVAIHAGPGGDLYYADITNGSIWQLKYAPGNRPPEVKVATTTTASTKTVCFDARDTVDLDGDSYTIRVAFGDGAFANGAEVCHSYPQAGATTTYNATITATDSAGGVGTKTITVAPANNAPAITVVSAPAVSKKFAVGEAITIQLRASDIENGQRPLNEQTEMVHCASLSDCHTHADGVVSVPADAGGLATYRTTFDDHGQNTSQVLRFTAKDSLGVETTWVYQAKPDLRLITAISPASVTIDGILTTSLQAAVGSENSISVPETSEHLVFSHWSDGGARAHNFTMGTTDVRLEAHFVTAIDKFNQALGGKLGSPIGAETSVGSGRMRPYQNGAIYWSPATGAHFVLGAIRGVYETQGGPIGTLGFPITDEFVITGGARQNFQNGALVWTPGVGTFQLFAANRAKYDALGAENGRLKLPISNEYVVAGGGVRQDFQGGSLLWSASTGSHLLAGGIRVAYDARGGSGGSLGFPITDEFVINGGVRQNFQGGSLIWSAASGNTFMLFAANGAKYDALGGPTSFLGLPVSNEYVVAGGGVRQDFQHGLLLWSAATGSQSVFSNGGIGARYLALGGPSGRLRLPTTDELVVAGGARQNFQGGYITWQAASGQVTVVYY
ncbi:MAG TPA: PQQ-dependent sugar dehydrogenase [Candidatus Saccharimonadales bacterium]